MVSIFTDTSSWGWKFFGGILGILAGIVVLNHPLWSTIAIPTYLVYLISVLAIAEGAVCLFMAFQGDGWGIGILGILSIIFGLVVILNPLIGVVALPLSWEGSCWSAALPRRGVIPLRSSPAATS